MKKLLLLCFITFVSIFDSCKKAVINADNISDSIPTGYCNVDSLGHIIGFTIDDKHYCTNEREFKASLNSYYSIRKMATN